MLKKENLDLSQYRLNQAKESLAEAKTLFGANQYKGASNRAYYAIFHAIKAILAIEQIDFKKHSSVLAYFNKEYVNKNVFPKEYGKYISNIQYYREHSDYADFFIVYKNDCEIQIKNSEILINSIEEYLQPFFNEITI